MKRGREAGGDRWEEMKEDREIKKNMGRVEAVEDEQEMEADREEKQR